jgi:hypothetical protein
MARTETVGRLFELAIAAENQLDNFYRTLTERFAHIPTVSVVWNAVADDETKHARTLANIRDSLPPNVLHCKEDPVQIRKAKEVLKAVTDNDLDSIKTLEDAYQLSLELEDSGVNMIFTLLVEQYAPSDGRLSFLLPAIEIHLERLKSFSHMPDSAIWRTGILATGAHNSTSGCVGILTPGLQDPTHKDLPSRDAQS